MLSPIDKLINEHGSSNILRYRLEIVKDEYQRLESKCSDLQSENGALSTELEQERERANQVQEGLDRYGSLATTQPSASCRIAAIWCTVTGKRPQAVDAALSPQAGGRDVLSERLKERIRSVVVP